MNSVVPALDFESLQREIEWLQRRRPRSSSVSRALDQLTSALEELRTAGEEIDVQQEEMLRVLGELDRQRAHYREVFDLLGDACLMTDTDGFVSDANSRAVALFGGRPEGVLDLSIASRSIVRRPPRSRRWPGVAPAPPPSSTTTACSRCARAASIRPSTGL